MQTQTTTFCIGLAVGQYLIVETTLSDHVWGITAATIMHGNPPATPTRHSNKW
jgi:hypothetical protein